MATTASQILSLASAHTGGEIARRLGWSVNDLDERDVRRGDTRLHAARGSVGGQPAALFATVAARNGYDPLDSAALYAYHTAVDWGLLAEEPGVTIFNSHRVVDGNWFRLRKFPGVRSRPIQTWCRLFRRKVC